MFFFCIDTKAFYPRTGDVMAEWTSFVAVEGLPVEAALAVADESAKSTAEWLANALGLDSTYQLTLMMPTN